MFQLQTRKQFDTARPLVLQFNDADGTVDLTGATVTFRMVDKRTGTVKIAAGSMTPLNQRTHTCQAQYAWQTADVNLAATYKCEAKAVFPDTTIAHFPSDEYAEITFYPAL